MYDDLAFPGVYIAFIVVLCLMVVAAILFASFVQTHGTLVAPTEAPAAWLIGRIA